MRTFNDTDHEYPRDSCIPDLFWEQARVQPDSTAVGFENENITFRGLGGRGSALAGRLRHLGVVPDDCVGLFVEPSIELMVGAWGILFAGGAYLPLSPEYPEELLRYMIEDSRAKVIFTQGKLKRRLTGFAPPGTEIVTLEDVPGLGERALPTGLHPNNLAYVIYTSGSTGKPKGVMIEHHSVVNQMHWLKTAYELNSQKTVVQKTPMSFDAAQWEILAPCCGSKVIMGPPGVYKDPARLLETIARNHVTTLQCVPTLLQALLETAELPSCQSLKEIFSGGEALSTRLARRCLETLPGCKLTNLYGPTECTIQTSAFTVGPQALQSNLNTISIGAPVFNTQYYILGDGLTPVPVGEVGELYIGGEQLARGYLHRPDLTAEKFIANPFSSDPGYATLYKTGDLAYWNPDGTVQFAGRVDNQVKLRGYRVELDAIKVAIETHDWVKNSAVVMKEDPRTGHQHLIAFIEINLREAAVMDANHPGAHHHHQTKEDRFQVRAQLSNPGCRDAAQLSGKAVVDLPGKLPTPDQELLVFARKTYRFFEGGEVTQADLLKLLGQTAAAPTASRNLDAVSFAELGEILRYFGQYLSEERLLPKYGYASPGALYATQMYLEISKIGDLKAGYYYYHPVHHQLFLLRETAGADTARIKLHFLGKRSAIEPVYKNFVEEVLEIETGHMIGLFEKILPRYGLGVRELEYAPATKDELECAEEDYYLGTFELIPNAGPPPDVPVEFYVQAQPGKIADLPAGQYRYHDGALERLPAETILKKHMIAINQPAYARSSFLITAISKTRKGWMGYIELGKALQHLQMNDLNLGLMPLGYSNKIGFVLPMLRIVGDIRRSRGEDAASPCYFFLGGRVSDEQVRSRGMKEDSVHMKGPAEMLRDDLINYLPEYMLPNKVVVLDNLPITANGKIDFKALDKIKVEFAHRPFCAPRTATEERLCQIWKEALKPEVVSVKDDFFESGGNSLIAVSLVTRINREFQSSLPLQILFTAPTIEELAQRLDSQRAGQSSRLIRLHAGGQQRPVYCWPGLGGYSMNLRLLASKAERPFYGVQAHGINEGETPYSTIREMAAEDVKLIQKLQPVGPYTLWGYSFGARVAFETAYQLEQVGAPVDSLFLIAPGSPKVEVNDAPANSKELSFHNPAYVTILFSVFAGTITGPELDACLKVARDEASFVSFICGMLKGLDAGLVRRITRIVGLTFQFQYTFQELAERRINAPITIFKARGDDYSFIENSSGYSARPPVLVELEADHYAVLKEAGLGELMKKMGSNA